MIGLDTNVLVRYIVEDDFEQAVVARQLIENICSTKNPGYISLMVLCELVWVLTVSYNCQHQQIVLVLESVLLTETFEVENHEIAWIAFYDFSEGNADFADCLMSRLNEQQGCMTTYTFDRRASQLPHNTLLKEEIL